MKQRCYDKNFKYYFRYGGKGVQVCKEWRDSYIAFRDWSHANGYEDNLSIDRINSSGNYTPSNCRWTTRTIQSRNIGMRSNNTSGFKGVYL